jgi:hypothetical protein
MAKMGDIYITVRDSLIEMQALITEREAMMAENQYRQQAGYGAAYVSGDFYSVAEKMRALKSEVAKPEHHTTGQV